MSWGQLTSAQCWDKSAVVCWTEIAKTWFLCPFNFHSKMSTGWSLANFQSQKLLVCQHLTNSTCLWHSWGPGLLKFPPLLWFRHMESNMAQDREKMSFLKNGLRMWVLLSVFSTLLLSKIGGLENQIKKQSISGDNSYTLPICYILGKVGNTGLVFFWAVHSFFKRVVTFLWELVSFSEKKENRFVVTDMRNQFLFCKPSFSPYKLFLGPKEFSNLLGWFSI